jgi:hypothetical protein
MTAESAAALAEVLARLAAAWWRARLEREKAADESAAEGASR